MAAVSPQQADAYDRMLDAAAELAELIAAGGIAVSERDLETLAVFLAGQAPVLRRLLRRVRPVSE